MVSDIIYIDLMIHTLCRVYNDRERERESVSVCVCVMVINVKCLLQTTKNSSIKEMCVLYFIEQHNRNNNY